MYKDVFYQDPQPGKEENDKVGFCGVKEYPHFGDHHQNCECTTTAPSFYELEMPNFCRMICNGLEECKGYSYSEPNSCRYYTNEVGCIWNGDLSSNHRFKCELRNSGKTGRLVNMDVGNEGKGCYIKNYA